MKNFFEELGIWGAMFTLLLLFSGILFWIHIWTSECGMGASFNNLFSDANKVTWGNMVVFLILTLVTTLAYIEVRTTIKEMETREEKRASFIAIIIGLIFTIFLFWQPMLIWIFEKLSANQILKGLLFGGSAVAGWFIWWLRRLEKYGDFFYVLLITATGGFCWYARVKGTSEAEVAAYTFLTASLAKIAFQYLDKAKRTIKPEVTNTTTRRL